MNLESVIVRVWRYTWRLRSSEIGDALGGCDRASLEIHISTMYFRHWKPQGVSERMWSVNIDASISAEYQTLGGHSCRPSE